MRGEACAFYRFPPGGAGSSGRPWRCPRGRTRHVSEPMYSAGLLSAGLVSGPLRGFARSGRLILGAPTVDAEECDRRHQRRQPRPVGGTGRAGVWRSWLASSGLIIFELLLSGMYLLVHHTRFRLRGRLCSFRRTWDRYASWRERSSACRSGMPCRPRWWRRRIQKALRIGHIVLADGEVGFRIVHVAHVAGRRVAGGCRVLVIEG